MPPFCSEKCVTVTVSVVSDGAGRAAMPFVNGSVGDSTVLIWVAPAPPPELVVTVVTGSPGRKQLLLPTLPVGEVATRVGAFGEAIMVVIVVWLLPPVGMVVVPVRFNVSLSPPCSAPPGF
uniref:Uncharacterized protein n=1 Tax=Anopheles maculatus TaxID=74869 RepID=A0A182SZ04_9DIPT